ncbi:MAG TPA: HAMP domain-containing protein [Anaerolineae bacterium]|nr:HAMP domain-containing protein [Anaerolineae bacterium]
MKDNAPATDPRPAHTSPRRRSLSIRGRLTIAFVLIVLLSAAAISTFSSLSYLQTERRQAVEHLEALAAMVENRFEEWVSHLQDTLAVAITRPMDAVFAHMLTTESTSPAESREARAHLQDDLEHIAGSGQVFAEVFLMDNRGNVVVSTEDGRTGAFDGGSAYFHAGLSGSYVGTPFYDAERSRMVVIAARPVVDRQGTVLGALAGRANLASFADPAFSRAGLGETGVMVLLDSNRALLTDFRFSDAGAPSEPSTIYIDTEGANAVTNSRGHGVGLYEGVRGAPVVGVYRWLPSLQAALLIEMEQAEAFRSAYDVLLVDAGVAAAVLLVALGVALFVVRSITSPLARLAGTAARIAGGDLDVEASVERDDEIGALARAFNHMTARLRNGINNLKQHAADREQTAEALREAHDELEIRVQLRTSELVQANAALRAEMEKSRLQTTALEAAANAIVITDRMANIEWCNTAFLQMTGYSFEEIGGRNLRMLKSGRHDSALYVQLWDTVLAGQAWHGRMVNRRRDGSLYTEEQTIAPVFDEKGELSHFIAVKQDVTDRIRVEEEIKRRNQELAVINAASLALTRTLDLDTVLDTLLEYVGRLVPYTSARAFLLEADSRLTIRAARGGEPRTDAERAGLLSLDVASNRTVQELLTGGKSLSIPNVDDVPDWDDRFSGGKSRHWLGVPLATGDKVIGLCSLSSHAPDAFTREHLQLAEALVGQATVAVQNAWLFAQVRAGRERLQALSRRLVEVQESERRYIARELHDEAGQALTALLVGLRLLEREAHRPEAVVAGVIELKRTVDEVLENLHRLAIDLRPASLDHLGLVPALRQHAEAISDRHGLTVQFEAIGVGDRRLPPDMETAVYRIVQEALTNAVRHARATRVELLLEQRGSRLIAIVEDNGIGFDPDAAQRGGRLGLFGMRERAEMFGGALVVESEAGFGTTVLLEMPCDATHPHRPTAPSAPSVSQRSGDAL